MAGEKIIYGWKPDQGIYSRADVFHVECRPNLPWLTSVADVSLAEHIDVSKIYGGHGHSRCDGCRELFPHAVARATQEA